MPFCNLFMEQPSYWQIWLWHKWCIRKVRSYEKHWQWVMHVTKR